MPSPNSKAGLVAFLKKHPEDHPSFPQHNTDYYKRFDDLDGYLNNNVHPSINQGAAANDIGWLTDHGPEHISTVMRRASDLAMDGNKTFLTPYESYLLLLAIHFHDVGNVFGRDEHEKRIVNVLEGIKKNKGDLLGDDAAEVRLVTDIARAHGGYADFAKSDKDTIGPLRERWPTSSDGPRIQLLAALLRFADELADDFTRTSRFLLGSELISTESEAYHVYADRLREVKIQSSENNVSIRFEVTSKDLQRTFGKGKEQIYLYDEIALRVVKMHHEHIYCTRFLLPHVLIDTISVTINVSSDNTPDRFVDVLETITFRMRQAGYPSTPSMLSDISPEVAGISGQSLSDKYAAMGTNQP